MPKLATPVQYEPTLEGLNVIRPLQLKDEGKIVIPYPVLCKNPPTKDRPAVGKLARCSQQGALLAGNKDGYTTYEYIEQGFERDDGNKLIQFSQKVSCVQSLITVMGTITGGWWTDPTYTLEFKDIFSTYAVYLPFVGSDLYIKVTCAIPGFVTTIGFCGFY